MKYFPICFSHTNNQEMSWTIKTTIKVFGHQAYILFIRPNPWQGRVIFFCHFFSLFSLEFYKSLFLKIQDRICLFCHILFCSRYTVKNLVKVIKSKVGLNVDVFLSGYMGLDHPQRLFCVAVWKEGFLTRL